MNSETTFHIHLKGRVQGVGFRPFVYRLAQTLGMKGQVRNTSDGVHIHCNATAEAADRFVKKILAEAPENARITTHSLLEAPAMFFDSFTIVHSDDAADSDLLLAPDFAMCGDCRRELADRNNRRFAYPFITCTNCGPRFSISEKLPYDRKLTTMRDFAMCPACAAEYDLPTDRRYYSQTNSCPECGIRLFFEHFETGERTGDQADALKRTVELLQSGHVVALKGVGGFLLLGDATDREAVMRLRARKSRPAKPFAVLYPDLAVLAGDAVLQPEEEKMLTGPVSPIVLLKLRDAPASGISIETVAPGLGHIGAMLPYAPLLEQIGRAFGKPLIATSGNHGGSPIVFDDDAARTELPAVADAMLGHNRRIVAPQDDSVMRFTEKSVRPVVLRRARGLAPSAEFQGLAVPQRTVFCAGADMKSAFAWAQGGNVYLSPYIGDLEHFDTQQRYRFMVDHFFRLLRKTPEVVVADRHPGYFSTQIAAQLAMEWGAEFRQVQHHEAHFAAVLAENNLLDVAEPVLGVIWDGHGYGDEKLSRGGEFFRWQNRRMTLAAQWQAFPLLAGDKMAREPRLSALAVMHDLEGAASRLQEKFSSREWDFYHKTLKINSVMRTTSMGRMFDALASLVGCCDHNSYEGEAAMRLEHLAGSASDLPAVFVGQYMRPDGNLDTRQFFQDALDALHNNVPAERIAAAAHRTWVRTIEEVAQKNAIRDIAFSGGVFQNGLLVDLIHEMLGNKYRLHFHRQLSPNDECIATGQLIMSDE